MWFHNVYVLLCSLGMGSQLLIHTTCRKLTDSYLALPQGAPIGRARKPGLSPSCLPGHEWQLMALHAVARLALANYYWPLLGARNGLLPTQSNTVLKHRGRTGVDRRKLLV